MNTYAEAVFPKDRGDLLVPIDDMWETIAKDLNEIKKYPRQSVNIVRLKLSNEYKEIQEAFNKDFGDIPDNDPDKARILDIFSLLESN